VPVPGLYWTDAASIGQVQARYWQPMACLQGSQNKLDVAEIYDSLRGQLKIYTYFHARVIIGSILVGNIRT